jgi:hypothetical protein
VADTYVPSLKSCADPGPKFTSVPDDTMSSVIPFRVKIVFDPVVDINVTYLLVNIGDPVPIVYTAIPKITNGTDEVTNCIVDLFAELAAFVVAENAAPV